MLREFGRPSQAATWCSTWRRGQVIEALPGGHVDAETLAYSDDLGSRSHATPLGTLS